MSPPKTPQSVHFDDASLQSFCDVLGTRTGLQVRDKDRGAVSRTLVARCEALSLSAPAYLQRLRVEKVDGPEWTRLMPHLTNGESYFERDKGQFALLRDTILPELIAARRGGVNRTLRLWSAGCSTGEEAYSLAMAAQGTLPPGWKATIVGTDINGEAVQKARRGIYSAWSFRGVAETTRNRYFRAVAGGFEVVPELRAQVTFGFCNLSMDDWPDAGRGLADMDLIVCRNVLIYFQRAVVAGVLSRFARTLRPDGFLLTGHAELHDQNVSSLKARLFPASAAYQKATEEIPSRMSASRPPSPKTTTAPATAVPIPVHSLLPTAAVSARAVSTTGRSPSIAPAATSLADAKTKTAKDWCLEARRLADSARYEEAVAACRRAIGMNPSHEEAYLLWAQIAEEQGQSSTAKELLKKVIYLEPSHAEAYVGLAAIYEREGATARARQMRVSALKLLQSAPVNVISPSTTSAELLHHVQELLGLGNSDNSKASPSGGGR